MMVPSVTVQIAIKSESEKAKKPREGVSESLVKDPVCTQSIPRPAYFSEGGVTAQILCWE